MHTSEARSYSSDEAGCATHALLDCLCDVQLLESVQIRTVPHAARLLELGVDRFSFVTWAEEIAAWMDTQVGLQLVAEA